MFNSEINSENPLLIVLFGSRKNKRWPIVDGTTRWYFRPDDNLEIYHSFDRSQHSHIRSDQYMWVHHHRDRNQQDIYKWSCLQCSYTHESNRHCSFLKIFLLFRVLVVNNKSGWAWRKIYIGNQVIYRLFDKNQHSLAHSSIS